MIFRRKRPNSDSMINQIPNRIMKKVYENHKDLVASPRVKGWGPWKVQEYVIICQCGYEDPKRIPILPVEMQMTTSFLIHVAFENHLREEARKLGYKR